MNQAVLQGIAKQWGVANTLTALRCVLTLPIMILLFFGYYYTAAGLAVFAAATDAEGFYARWTSTHTELGRVFDPLADKVFTDILLIALAFVSYNQWVLLLALVTIGYDIDNTLRRVTEILAACKNKERVQNDTPVTWVSKTKTTVLFLTVIVLLFSLASSDLSFLVSMCVPSAIVLVLLSWGLNRQAFLSRFL